MKTRNITLKITVVVIWLMPVMVFAWLLSKYFVLSGTLNVYYDIDHETEMVKNFASKEPERIIAMPQNGVGESTQVITKSPMYFNVDVPRPFQEAVVTVQYQNPQQQPVVKLGVQQANDAYYFFDLAYNDARLDTLSGEWERIEDGNLVLWQKNNAYLKIINDQESGRKNDLEQADAEFESQKQALESRRGSGLSQEEYEHLLSDLTQESLFNRSEIEHKYQVSNRPLPPYASIGDFLSDLPPSATTLQYNYNLQKHAKVPGRVPVVGGISIDTSLRGKHELMTVLDEKEDLDFSFVFQNINRHEGSDIIRIEVWDFEKKVFEKALEPLGSDKVSSQPSEELTFNLQPKDLIAGVYRIVIDAHDDIFIKSIKTKQGSLMFKRNLYLAENEEFQSILGDKQLMPTSIVTDGEFIHVETPHDKGLQTITVDGKATVISRLHVPYTIRDLSGITPIVTPKNDIKLTSEGYFAFDRLHMFQMPVQYDEYTTDKDLRNYDFVFARYPRAVQDDGYLTAQAKVSTPILYFKDNKARFILDFPGMAEQNKQIRIKSIHIKFTKPPIRLGNLVPKLTQYIKRAIQ